MNPIALFGIARTGNPAASSARSLVCEREVAMPLPQNSLTTCRRSVAPASTSIAAIPRFLRRRRESRGPGACAAPRSERNLTDSAVGRLADGD